MIPADVKKRILAKIVPTEREVIHIKQKISTFIALLEKAAQEVAIDVSFKIGGSFGKQTFLKNDFDVDIFCVFSKEYYLDDISSLLQCVLEATRMKFMTQKGSRNYYQIRYSSLMYELVPVLHVDSYKDMKNVTDLSLHHVAYVLGHTTKAVRDEIRLAKLYFKAKKLYGAESYINAFSGHVIDLLLIHFKTLNNLLRSAKTWGEQTIIDIATHHKSKETLLGVLDKSKITNLIVIDPIVPNRNAASALNIENYYRFLYEVSVEPVVQDQSLECQEVRIERELKVMSQFCKENGLTCFGYIFDVDPSTETRDIVGSKMLKLFKRVGMMLTDYGFAIFKKAFLISFNEHRCLFFYMLEQSHLSKVEVVSGPSVLMREAVREFVKSHHEVVLYEGRLIAYKKRDVHSIRDIYLSIQDFEKIVGKNLEFVKKIRTIH